MAACRRACGPLEQQKQNPRRLYADFTRPAVLTSKNALFAGSDGGAEHWAAIASLVETAKLNGVEPHAYLADVIARIVSGHPNSRIDELLPWAYPAHAALRDVA